MIVLGIESSCDETAVSIVEDGCRVLSSIIASQADLHSLYGGVVPEIASREHAKAITPALRACLDQAGMSLSDIDAFGVTYGPGLIGALIVGVSYAKALAYAQKKPLYAVHHIAGHVSANLIQHKDLEPPFLCLVASGGHSHIVLVEDYTSYKIIAGTRDDAAGEAFDKIARRIGLGYPGGPKIDKEARGGNKEAIVFPRSKLSGNSLDFSFSGLKTSALNFINQLEQEARKRGQDPWAIYSRKDFAASYQEAIVSVLVDHTMEAARQYKIDKIAIAGGVAANSSLKETFIRATAKENKTFYHPDPVLCTDNAMMIASLTYFMAKAGMEPSNLNLDAKASLNLKAFAKMA